MKSRYSISLSASELETDSEAIFEQGFDMIDTKFNNGVWFTAYGNNIGKPERVEQVTAWRGVSTFSDFQEQVEEQKADGFELTDVEVTPGGYWLGTFNSGSGQLESELITAETYADFNRQVDDLQAQDASFVLGYQVVDIEYDDGLYIGVLDRNGSDADYQFMRSYQDFTEEVAFQREEGLELTNVEYVGGANGGWYAVFTDELTGLSVYSPETHALRSDFESEIVAYRSQGYDLINIESIEGEWFGIYKEDIYFDDPLVSSSSSTSEDTVSILRSAGAETNASAIGIGIIADSYSE